MRFYVIKSKTIKFVIFMLLAMLLLTFKVNSSSECLASVFFNTKRKIPIYCVDRTEQQIAISFDAAWGSDKTTSILEILKEYNIPATFFLVGMWVDKNPQLVKNIDEQGCEIGTHSNLHPDFVKLSNDQMQLELSTSCKKIEDITNKKVNLFRCPYGSYNNAVLNVAEKQQLQTIQWDVDSLDWKGISSTQICKNILTKTKNGSIILCHNNAEHIVEALPTIISTLQSRGYKFVTISSLIYKDNFRIDSTGKQIKN